MALFDYITIKNTPLPYPEGLAKFPSSYQTKDLDCGLGEYIINEGRLYEIQVKREWVADGNGPLKGYMKEISQQIVDSNHTGDVYFYESIQDYDEANDAWIEFKGTFIKGILTECVLKEFELRGNQDRKNWAADFAREASEEAILRERWYFPVISATRWVRSGIRSNLGKFFLALGGGFSNVGYWIYRNL